MSVIGTYNTTLEEMATPELATAMFESPDRVGFCRAKVHEAGLPLWLHRTLEAYLSNLHHYGRINP